MAVVLAETLVVVKFGRAGGTFGAPFPLRVKAAWAAAVGGGAAVLAAWAARERLAAGRARAAPCGLCARARRRRAAGVAVWAAVSRGGTGGAAVPAVEAACAPGAILRLPA
jgi:hypothetical protein